ncbi:MAG: TonB C-terminal domain-containing protein [Pseudomonadota bacterium]
MTDDIATTELPFFLERLELDLDADARAIRRAYARLLKLIDQEQDPATFQALREAYEIGLNWAAHMAYEKAQAAQEAGDDPAPDAAMPVSLEKTAPAPAAEFTVPGDLQGADLVDPNDLANAVFERFSAACDVLSQGRMCADVALWMDEINQRLNDDELFNITARTIFEARLVYLLASGWKTGHETLFAAATKVFRWENDRRRLHQFGHAGAMVNRAIEELKMFEVQDQAELFTQRKVLTRLRAAVMPDTDQLKRDMFYMERMVSRFPNLMSMWISGDAVEQWRSLHQTVPAARRGQAFVIDDTPEPTLGTGKRGARDIPKWVYVLSFIVAINLLRMALPDGPATPQLQEQASYEPRNPLDQAMIKAIADDIQYTPSKNANPGTLKVDYEVFFDENGQAYGMYVLNSSGDPAFDDAVRASILRAKPLAANKGEQRRMSFSQTVSRQKTTPPAEQADKPVSRENIPHNWLDTPGKKPAWALPESPADKKPAWLSEVVSPVTPPEKPAPKD